MHRISHLAVVVFLISGVCALSQAAKPDRDPKAPSHESIATFRDCPGCPEMVVIPAGTFWMGSAAGEGDTVVEEVPRRKVTVRKFALSKFDTTRGEWAAFVAATKRPSSDGCDYSMLPKETEAKASWSNLGFTQDDNHPVVCVTFEDAHDYAAWLTKRTGQRYRLPSEAEWEYAARAGTATPYPWGSKASHEFANYGGEDHPGYGVVSGRDKWASTSPVGAFPPNAFGLYDTNGNVMQWVEDCFSKTYANLPVDGSANIASVPVKDMSEDFVAMNGKDACSFRMLRGGDWGDPPPMIRAASRNFAPPPDQTLAHYRSSGLGIRLARDWDNQR